VRKTLTAVVLAAAVVTATAGCSGQSGSASSAARATTSAVEAVANTPQICASLVDWALELSNEHDPTTATFFTLLDDESRVPPQQRVEIRHAYYHKQELAIRQLAATASDTQLATLLRNFADSWAALAANTSPDGPDTIQPYRGPIDTACPGIEHKIAVASNANGT
jgi:hypothetical protein